MTAPKRHCKYPGCAEELPVQAGRGRPREYCVHHTTSPLRQGRTNISPTDVWIEITKDGDAAEVTLVAHKRWGVLAVLYHGTCKRRWSEASEMVVRWQGALGCTVDDMTPRGLSYYVHKDKPGCEGK